MALATVKPRVALLSWKNSSSQCVVPEITAVSNPNKSPPSAATTAESMRVCLLFMRRDLKYPLNISNPYDNLYYSTAKSIFKNKKFGSIIRIV
jgi:hypothetical protein